MSGIEWRDGETVRHVLDRIDLNQATCGPAAADTVYHDSHDCNENMQTPECVAPTYTFPDGSEVLCNYQTCTECAGVACTASCSAGSPS